MSYKLSRYSTAGMYTSSFLEQRVYYGHIMTIYSMFRRQRDEKLISCSHITILKDLKQKFKTFNVHRKIIYLLF